MSSVHATPCMHIQEGYGMEGVREARRERREGKREGESYWLVQVQDVDGILCT